MVGGQVTKIISTRQIIVDEDDELFDILKNNKDMNIAYCNECTEDENGNPIAESETSNIALDINKIKIKKFADVVKLPFTDASKITMMSDPEEGYLSYCSEVNHFAYRYQLLNKFYPTIYRFEEFNTSQFINSLFKHYTIPENSYIKITFQGNDDAKITSFLITFSDDLVLFFDGVNEGTLYYNASDEKNEDSLLYTILGLMKNYKKPKVTKNKIYIVYKDPHGFNKIGFDVKKIKVDLHENYNDGFAEISEKIIDGLNSKDKTNLVILPGEPGTGKTTFVRYLTSKLKKNIIFISPDMVDSITDPAFIPFLMKNNDSILIIEDAEPALEKRGAGSRSSAVSNVLNLTDGLLSDCLKISIVATFNTGTKNIDEALLRKGRLLMNYKFERLCVEKSKKLLEKLGHAEVEVKEPMTLADIYYYGTDNNIAKKDKKIGFNQ